MTIVPTAAMTAATTPPEPPDDAVVASVLAGRTRDFELLVERYGRRLANFINRMIFDWDEAQSLTQDVFVQVYENLNRYRSENNFQAFVFTIARNLTFNWLKKRRRLVFFSHILKTDQYTAGLPREGGTAAAAEAEETTQRVTAALKMLPEEQRLALVMKVYLEFPYHRIAEITGWSEPKIETLIFRAKKKLQGILLQEKE